MGNFLHTNLLIASLLMTGHVFSSYAKDHDYFYIANESDCDVTGYIYMAEPTYVEDKEYYWAGSGSHELPDLDKIYYNIKSEFGKGFKKYKSAIVFGITGHCEPGSDDIQPYHYEYGQKAYDHFKITGSGKGHRQIMAVTD